MNGWQRLERTDMIELAYINRDSFSNARYQMEPCIKMLAKVEILKTEENGLD
jgi:hypothetical protein